MKPAPLAHEHNHGGVSRGSLTRGIAKLILWLAVVFAVTYFAYQAIHAGGWSGTLRSDRFRHALASVRISYLLLAVVFVYCSYVFRSLRWRAFLKPIKAASSANILVATLIGFSAVAFVGRPGELVRPLLVARKERLTLSSQLAAWTLERIFDGLALSVMMGVALAFLARTPSHAAISQGLELGALALCTGAIVMTVALLQLRRRSGSLIRILLWLLKPLPERYHNKIHGVLVRGLDSFTAGLGSIGTVAGFITLSLLSALVWLPVIAAFWTVAQAFGGSMAALSVGAIIVVIVITVAGSLVQIPGIGGGPQIASGLALTQLFGIPLEVASTAAVVIWLVAFISVLLGGIPLAAREGLDWRKVREMAKTGDLKTAT
jgi:glycosyltransferase 2 family protein